jgi:hypothetical protein
LSAQPYSYYHLLQATPQLDLQVIAAGRYHDYFFFSNGKWLFEERMAFLDLLGNASGHVPEAWIPQMRRLCARRIDPPMPSLADVLSAIDLSQHAWVHRAARRGSLLGVPLSPLGWRVEIDMAEVCTLARDAS